MRNNTQLSNSSCSSSTNHATSFSLSLYAAWCFAMAQENHNNNVTFADVFVLKMLVDGKWQLANGYTSYHFTYFIFRLRNSKFNINVSVCVCVPMLCMRSNLTHRPRCLINYLVCKCEIQIFILLFPAVPTIHTIRHCMYKILCVCDAHVQCYISIL